LIGAQVELNNAEQRLARFMARSRMDNAMKRGITNAQVGSQDRFDIDLEGYGAELAFCKLFNVYPDMSIVADPSAPDAFVDGVMEGVEWIWDNGVIKAQKIEEYKHSIQRAKTQKLQEVKLNVFNDFLKNL